MHTPSECVDEGTLPAITEGVAHDLRNLLFVATAKCLQLLETFDASDPRRAELATIRDATDRAASLARHLLACTQQGDAPMAAPLDLNGVLGGVLPLVRHLVGDRIEVHTRLVRAPWPVSANATQVEQIILNLITNAREAMPSGGHITISTENRSVTLPGATQPAQYVVLSVADTGIGMDADVQSRMFDLHYTTKAEHGGTGVGLATVHSIATLNGGHAEVSSAVGEGTVVRVVLPRVDAAGGALAGSPRADACADEVFPSRERVLVVEDEPVVRELLFNCLTAHGYHALAAPNGGEALQTCQSAGHPIDLLVADINLPDMKGPELARRLRRERPDLQVVFISGQLAPAASVALGDAPVLTKPFSMVDFTRVVRAALDGSPVG